jgi:hypothetical protein
VGLISRALEARGMPTLTMSCLYEAALAYKPPRPVFLDFPIGCPSGKPNEPTLQRDILRSALELAPAFGDPWQIRQLPHQWSPDGSRAWEEEVRNLYRNAANIVAAHTADHRARGESLLGKEREFSLRCYC